MTVSERFISNIVVLCGFVAFVVVVIDLQYIGPTPRLAVALACAAASVGFVLYRVLSPRNAAIAKSDDNAIDLSYVLLVTALGTFMCGVWFYFPDTYLIRSEYALYQGRYDDAARLAERARDFSQLPHTKRAEAFQKQGSSIVFKAVSFDLTDEEIYKGLELLVAADTRRPNTPETQQGLAEAFALLGAYQNALDLIRDAPRQRFLWHYRFAIQEARIYRKVGRFEDAISVLENLGQRDHSWARDGANRHLGRIYFQLGDLENAEEKFTAALGEEPEDGWLLLRRACVRSRLGNLEAALEDAENADAEFEHEATYLNFSADTDAGDHNTAQIKKEIANIRALAAGEPPLIPAERQCKGFWREYEPARSRSPVLSSYN